MFSSSPGLHTFDPSNITNTIVTTKMSPEISTCCCGAAFPLVENHCSMGFLPSEYNYLEEGLFSTFQVYNKVKNEDIKFVLQ